jgi:putative endonuclease
VANKPGGMIYTGVTAYLAERITQHRENRGSSYCRKFGIKMLVYAEWHDDIHDAIVREKRIKAWKREWRVALIEESNSDWRDLYDTLA